MVPDGTTQIGPDFFEGCEGLISVTIPEGVTTIGHFAFFDCEALENIYFCGDAPEFVNHENINGSFAATTATAYYHQGTEGWTEENKSKTGGSITWVELEHIVFDEGPDARCVVCGELAEKNTAIDPEIPNEGTGVPPTQDVPKEEPPQAEVPKEENPKTADQIADLAGILLIVLAAGCMLLLKKPSKNTKV